MITNDFVIDVVVRISNNQQSLWGERTIYVAVCGKGSGIALMSLHHDLTIISVIWCVSSGGSCICSTYSVINTIKIFITICGDFL